MTVVNYKSTRLLVEAVKREMDAIRKAAMGNMALGSLNDLRELVDQLVRRAERLAVEDVQELAPRDYVKMMKPLVANYHRLLVVKDMLAPCLCEDLGADACVVLVVGAGNTLVRAAHNPSRPETALVVETILAQLDDGTKKVAADAAAAREGFDGIDRQVGEPLRYETTPLTLEAVEVGVRDTLAVVDDVCPICGGEAMEAGTCPGCGGSGREPA